MTTLNINRKVENYLLNRGADFIHFVDIQSIENSQTRGFASAVLFGVALSKQYIKKVSNKADYVQQLKLNQQFHLDEFHRKETTTDAWADDLAIFIEKLGYRAISQSEKNLETHGGYHVQTKTTLLPHKTIALMAGLGWIGKHNLLITKKFGSAFSMCTVLTNAPLETHNAASLSNQCGNCQICKQVCPVKVITGEHWNIRNTRNTLINVHGCITCLRCMVMCPLTQKYVNK